jgi:hypothetical protein
MAAMAGNAGSAALFVRLHVDAAMSAHKSCSRDGQLILCHRVIGPQASFRPRLAAAVTIAVAGGLIDFECGIGKDSALINRL